MTTATIGLRRLEMMGDRIEAVCASHKITGRVWGGTVTRRNMLFTLTTLTGVSDSALRILREETELSLGLPVALERDGAALLVRVGREWPSRPPAQPAPAIPEPNPWPMRLAWTAFAILFTVETVLAVHGVAWLIGRTP